MGGRGGKISGRLELEPSAQELFFARELGGGGGGGKRDNYLLDKELEGF